jgi:hypothetical protein
VAGALLKTHESFGGGTESVYLGPVSGLLGRIVLGNIHSDAEQSRCWQCRFRYLEAASGKILMPQTHLFRFQIKDDIKAARIEATKAYR